MAFLNSRICSHLFTFFCGEWVSECLGEFLILTSSRWSFCSHSSTRVLHRMMRAEINWQGQWKPEKLIFFCPMHIVSKHICVCKHCIQLPYGFPRGRAVRRGLRPAILRELRCRGGRDWRRAPGCGLQAALAALSWPPCFHFFPPMAQVFGVTQKPSHSKGQRGIHHRCSGFAMRTERIRYKDLIRVVLCGHLLKNHDWGSLCTNTPHGALRPNPAPFLSLQRIFPAAYLSGICVYPPPPKKLIHPSCINPALLCGLQAALAALQWPPCFHVVFPMAQVFGVTRKKIRCTQTCNLIPVPRLCGVFFWSWSVGVATGCLWCLDAFHLKPRGCQRSTLPPPLTLLVAHIRYCKWIHKSKELKSWHEIQFQGGQFPPPPFPMTTANTAWTKLKHPNRIGEQHAGGGNPVAIAVAVGCIRREKMKCSKRSLFGTGRVGRGDSFGGSPTVERYKKTISLQWYHLLCHYGIKKSFWAFPAVFNQHRFLFSVYLGRTRFGRHCTNSYSPYSVLLWVFRKLTIFRSCTISRH